MDTIVAANGPDGIAMAKNEKPDVILLDLGMPVMDGWSVLEKLKSDSGLSKIPVVMIGLPGR